MQLVAVSGEAVDGLKFFRGLPPWVGPLVAGAASEVRCAEGHVLLRQHDEVRAASFLTSGGVQFLLRFEGVDDLLVGATAEHGELIGWSMFRAPFRSTATVRCDRPTSLLTVPREAFAEMFARDTRVEYEILRRVAAVAAGRLLRAREILLGAAGRAEPEGAQF